MFDFFDKIICINLSTRPDKKSYVKAIFNKLNISNVDFFTTKPHVKGGRYGCFESHINVIETAYKQGCSNILIFEDDVRPSPTYNETHMKNAIHFLSSQPNVDILQLGHFPFQNENGLLQTYITSERVSNFKNIIKFAGTSTHAYCLTRKGFNSYMILYLKMTIQRKNYIKIILQYIIK